MPTMDSRELLLPHQRALAGTKGELRRGLAHLELLFYRVKKVLAQPGKADLIRNYRSYATEYLKVASASKRLKNVDIRLFGLDGHTELVRTKHVSVDQKLDYMASTHLRRLVLHSVNISTGQLRRLIGLYGDQASHFKLRWVCLSDGDWASILDVARAKIGSRVQAGACVFRIQGIQGPKAWQTFWKHYLSRTTQKLGDSMEQLEWAGERYVAGKHPTNPMLAYNLQLESFNTPQ